jgi:threonine/homoserine/homoserine lactone efflux protein
MATHFLAFLGLIAVLVAIPGPAVVLVAKSTLMRGRRSALMTAVGVLSGDAVWVAASVAGVTAVLVASRPAFETLRLLGAAYLIYLGVRLAVQRHGLGLTDGVRPGTRVAKPARKAFAEGALCELSNPKTLLVFTSVIPPFVPAGGGVADVAVLGVAFALLGFVSLLVYAAVLGVTRRAVRRRSCAWATW